MSNRREKAREDSPPRRARRESPPRRPRGESPPRRARGDSPPRQDRRESPPRRPKGESPPRQARGGSPPRRRRTWSNGAAQDRKREEQHDLNGKDAGVNGDAEVKKEMESSIPDGPNPPLPQVKEEEIVEGPQRPEPVPEFRILPRPAKPEVGKRDKRMFGAIMNHLGAARSRLDRDKDLITKQTRAEEAAARKQREQASKLHHLAIDLTKRRRQLQTAKKEEEVIKAQILEREQLTEAWIKSQEPLRSVIMTKATPRLAWIPKEHTEITAAAVEDQSKDVDDIVSTRLEEDAAYAKDLEDALSERFPILRDADDHLLGLKPHELDTPVHDERDNRKRGRGESDVANGSEENEGRREKSHKRSTQQ